ncbi:hypothetical protein Bca4012_091682 [Brassica carinata]
MCVERWKKFFPSIVVDVEAEDDSVAYLGRVKVKATIQLLSLAVAVKKTSFTRYSYPLVHRDGCERVWMILDLSQIPLVIILRLFGWRWAYTTLTSSMSVSSTMVWPYGPTAGFWTLSKLPSTPSSSHPRKGDDSSFLLMHFLGHTNFSSSSTSFSAIGLFEL